MLLSVPAKDEIDATIVLGVNDEDLKPEHKIVSNAFMHDKLSGSDCESVKRFIWC